MFFKQAILITSALVALAAATPTPGGGSASGGEPASQCTTAPVQCCQSVEKASSPSAAAILGPLGVVLDDLDVLVGLTCSPISVIGVGGSECSANAVCCSDNSHGSLISIGCLPVTL